MNKIVIGDSTRHLEKTGHLTYQMLSGYVGKQQFFKWVKEHDPCYIVKGVLPVYDLYFSHRAGVMNFAIKDGNAHLAVNANMLSFFDAHSLTFVSGTWIQASLKSMRAVLEPFVHVHGGIVREIEVQGSKSLREVLNIICWPERLRPNMGWH